MHSLIVKKGINFFYSYSHSCYAMNRARWRVGVGDIAGRVG